MIDELLAYVALQNFADAKRTIFYWDILAFTERAKSLVEGVLATYWSNEAT